MTLWLLHLDVVGFLIPHPTHLDPGEDTCPSCAAKRVAAFTDCVVSEVLEPVSHRQVVFTIPTALRGLFRKDRRLLGKLCRYAWETLVEMHRAAFSEEEVMGAAVIAIQTARDQIQWHPHLHALVPDAVWTRDGRRRPISYLDPDALTRIFQAKSWMGWSANTASARSSPPSSGPGGTADFRSTGRNQSSPTTPRLWSGCAPTSAGRFSPPRAWSTTREPRDEARIDPPSVADVDAPFVDDVPTYTD